jgi:hypothetical protein
MFDDVKFVSFFEFVQFKVKMWSVINSKIQYFQVHFGPLTPGSLYILHLPEYKRDLFLIYQLRNAGSLYNLEIKKYSV